MHIREYVYQPGLNKAQPLSPRMQKILGHHTWGDRDTELEVPASGGLGVFIEEIRPWMQYNGHRIIEVRVRKSDVIHVGMWGGSYAAHVRSLWCDEKDFA